MKTDFSYAALRSELTAIVNAGYRSIRCIDYADRMGKPCDPTEKLLVVRIDVDLSLAKAAPMLDILKDTGVLASFFVRLHAPEYNPFSFEGYRMLRRIVAEGHELGYHSEVVDEADIWGEDAAACLRRDIAVLSAMAGVPIVSAASHGGLTGNNNLDFFKAHDPGDFGLRYEAYENSERFNLFHASRYVSDSEWTRWKSYENGTRIDGDHRPPSGHLADAPPLLHLLVHPDTYYVNHFYERER